MNKINKKMINEIVKILKKNDVVKAGLFGSYARGEANKNSDIDILVEIKKEISLLGFIGLKLKLEEKLKKKVDLVEYNTIKPLIRDSILNEEVKIL